MARHVLLITSNVAYACTEADVAKSWVEQMALKISGCGAALAVIHLQECSSGVQPTVKATIEGLLSSLLASLPAYAGVAFVDVHTDVVERFTALGVIAVFLKTAPVSRWNFATRAWAGAEGEGERVEDCSSSRFCVHMKFAIGMFGQSRHARKGFLQTRWKVHDKSFDAINVHLFHDACNIISSSAWPSKYALSRREALQHVLDNYDSESYHGHDTRQARKRRRGEGNTPRPLFVFGDFNFRLDLRQFVERHCPQPPRRETVDGEEQHVFEGKKGKVLLVLRTKKFDYGLKADLSMPGVLKLLAMDKERHAFDGVLFEKPISFAPSYPLAVPHKDPHGYADSRCPAWCDRVFMSASARDLLQDQGEYGTIGDGVCVGDHKPVYLLVPISNT